MNKNDFIIEVENLTRRFDETIAVRDLNFRVKRGEVFGVVGPDGAGKTTTMRILAGILTPTAGEACVDGISVTENPEGVKERIAYMPQRFGLYEDLTVLENLMFYADLFGVPRKERAEKKERLLGFSRLDPFENRLAGALSGGMKQKLGLACALIHSPHLLLLDEPTNGVDPVSRRDFWRILHDLVKEGMSILVSTAYLDEAERAHRVGLMSSGSMTHQGAPDEIKGLIEGVFFDIEVSKPSEALKRLSEISEVLDVNLYGEGLHVRARPDTEADTLRNRLKDADIDVTGIRGIPPSMEDAFLSLVRDASESGEERR